MLSPQARHEAMNLLEADFQEEILSAEEGALLFSPELSAGQLLLIFSGSVRLIDPSRIMGSLTLAKLEAPLAFGVSQLLDVSCHEEVRALTPCRYVLIDANTIKKDTLSTIKELVLADVSLSECALIIAWLKNAQIPTDSKTEDIEDFKKLCGIVKAIGNNTGEIIFFLDSPRDGFTYGQILTPQACNKFFSIESLPRLASIDLPKKPTSSELGALPQLPQKSAEKTVNTEELKRLIPQTPELQDEQTISNKDDFRVVSGTNVKDVFAACLTMLVQFFQLPTRRDTIARASQILESCKPNNASKQQNEQKKINPYINRFISILDELGLAVRTVRVEQDRPLRVPTPAVWIDSEGYALIITRATARSLIIIDPRYGRQELTKEEARERFCEQPELVSVDIGLHTPRKRFNIKWLFPYIKRYRIQLIEVFSASFLNQLFALATPLLFQQIIDRVISKGSFDALAPLVILMLMFTLLETVFSSLRTFQFVEVSNRIDIGVGSAILSRLLRVNARFFDRRPVGELASRLGELENIRRFLTGTALTVVLDSLFSLLYFAVMFFYSPLLTLVVLLTIPLLLLVTVGITPITQKLIRARAEAASRTQSLLVEILGGIQTVKLQNAELTARRQWEDRHLDSINQGFKAVLANTTSSNVLQLINKVSSILVIGVGAWLVLRNELTLGQLIAFRIISGYVTQPMLRLASSWQSFQELSLSLERVGDVVNQPLEISEEEEANVVMPPLRGDISILSVGYNYSSTSPPVLSSVNLEIAAGSFIGLVGQSGCGKSTLLKMVPRLYRPSSGKLLIDQLDIAKVDLYSLRSQIGFVPQDCLLFEGTVFSNIALGDPQAESNHVVEMAKITCAHEFIMELPYGYSTPVGEKGSGLSGGQRQRIALARMLLENPRMIVLDEATSALDANTEKQVVKNLRNHLAGRTVLMITHRLSTLIEADKIVIMHAGRVDEAGTHQQLMSQKGRYFALYQSQFGES